MGNLPLSSLWERVLKLNFSRLELGPVTVVRVWRKQRRTVPQPTLSSSKCNAVPLSVKSTRNLGQLFKRKEGHRCGVHGRLGVASPTIGGAFAVIVVR